ncbi:MAG: hypothetical protein C0521_00895 [Xanthomonas sp.]|nr:hypothetical protein [Xanthomonas sp.]
MSRKRDYIAELLDKRSRAYLRKPRIKELQLKVYPLVEGFRKIKALDSGVSYRDEWLKYGAIGYVACMEFYVKRLVADLIDRGEPFVSNAKSFDQVSFTASSVIAIHSKKVSLGEFITHFLPVSSVSHVNSHLSKVLGVDDFFREMLLAPASEWNTEPFGEVFPDAVSRAEELFRLRHVYCHELGVKKKVPIRAIEDGISAFAGLIFQMEEVVSVSHLKEGSFWRRA